MRIYTPILVSTLLVVGINHPPHHPTAIHVALSPVSGELSAVLATPTNPDVEPQGIPHRGSGR